MTGVLTSRPVTTEAETGVLQLQARNTEDFQSLPEARKAQRDASLETYREHAPSKYLDFGHLGSRIAGK